MVVGFEKWVDECQKGVQKNDGTDGRCRREWVGGMGWGVGSGKTSMMAKRMQQRCKRCKRAAGMPAARTQTCRRGAAEGGARRPKGSST